MTTADIAQNLAEVKSRMKDACRRAGREEKTVRLLAVGKRQPIERLQAAYDAGHRDFGENYVPALEERRAQLPGEAIWHMIGHLQTNKAKRAAVADWIHTIDSERVAKAVCKGTVGRDAPLMTLIEVNVAGEASKSGVRPEEAEPLLEVLCGLEGIEVIGLMCIPPAGEGRRWFSALRDLSERLGAATGHALPELSMGMSADYEDAIVEGATIIRVGTALFGPRAAPQGA